MTHNMDRLDVRLAAQELEDSRATLEVIEIGIDDPRSPSQIRLDAERNGGNPRMPGLERGIGYVANGDTNITQVQEQE